MLAVSGKCGFGAVDLDALWLTHCFVRLRWEPHPFTVPHTSRAVVRRGCRKEPAHDDAVAQYVRHYQAEELDERGNDLLLDRALQSLRTPQLQWRTYSASQFVVANNNQQHTRCN